MSNNKHTKTLALLVPGLSFAKRDRSTAAVICFILQLSFIGWIPAALWALLTLRNTKKQRVEQMLKAVREYNILPASKSSKQLSQ
ncbi:MAG: YqaE/Pmp3 family membrane protein [Chitinophagaceae bacterium]|nr:YqaE/Pmp3 family membrane protein [Chitinophagaceae bacterium]